MAEEAMIAYAKKAGLHPGFDLYGDFPRHRWYDFEYEPDFLAYYGPEARDYEVQPNPPARWLLCSTWRVRVKPESGKAEFAVVDMPRALKPGVLDTGVWFYRRDMGSNFQPTGKFIRRLPDGAWGEVYEERPSDV